MNCSVAQSLEVVGEWWTMLIVRDCFLGVTRFDDFQQRLGISRNILTERLDHLVANGVLVKVAYQEHPVRYDYRLTDKGRDLWAVLTALREWGDRWEADDGPPGGHRASWVRPPDHGGTHLLVVWRTSRCPVGAGPCRSGGANPPGRSPPALPHPLNLRPAQAPAATRLPAPGPVPPVCPEEPPSRGDPRPEERGPWFPFHLLGTLRHRDSGTLRVRRTMATVTVNFDECPELSDVVRSRCASVWRRREWTASDGLIDPTK